MQFYCSFDVLSFYAGIETRVLDVLDTDAVNAFAASLDRVDVLFNCAGYGATVVP